MQKERLWLLFSLAAVLICILVYILFFVARLSYYFGFLIVAILGLAFLVVTRKEEIVRNRKKILGEIGIVLGSCMVYTCVYVYISVFQAQFDVLTGISAFIGLIVGCAIGILVLDIGRSMIYICVSAISGIFVAVALLVSPPLLAGEYEIANYALLPTIQLVVLPVIFAITFSLFGAAIGYFVADSLL